MPALAKYIARKGSITVNGVSLTVNRVADLAAGCEASINLIPHTVQHTALHALSLPTVWAPETAGEALARTVQAILQEREEKI